MHSGDMPSGSAAALLVEVEDGSRFVTFHAATRSPARVGRRPDNDIVLPSKFAGRYHARIFWDEHGVEIEDADSPSGIYIDHCGVRGRARLEPETVVVLSDCKLKARLAPWPEAIVRGTERALVGLADATTEAELAGHFERYALAVEAAAKFSPVAALDLLVPTEMVLDALVKHEETTRRALARGLRDRIATGSASVTEQLRTTFGTFFDCHDFMHRLDTLARLLRSE